MIADRKLLSSQVAALAAVWLPVDRRAAALLESGWPAVALRAELALAAELSLVAAVLERFRARLLPRAASILLLCGQVPYLLLPGCAGDRYPWTSSGRPSRSGRAAMPCCAVRRDRLNRRAPRGGSG